MKRLILLPLALTSTLFAGGCMFGPLQRDYVSRAETIPVTAAPASTGTIPLQTSQAGENPDAEARRTAALLLPEGAGRITRIREKNFSNGTRQEIIIAADKGTYGENVIDVQIRTAEPGAKHTNPMQIGPPTENGMRNEILSRFPDVQMNIVTRPMRNGVGPFGLAIGKHASGSRCIYAWQWVEDLRENAPGSSNLSKMNALVAGRNLAASIRIRLCRSDSTVDQLASHIEGLRVSSGEALERIAKMDRRDIDSGPIASAGPRGTTPLVRPVGASLEAAITKPVRREAPPERVARAKPKKQEASRRQARREPAPPREPVQQAAPAAAPVYVPPPAPAAPAGAYGQRYLAPVAGGGAPVGYGGAPAVSQPSQGGLALPPQAYRGPAQ